MIRRVGRVSLGVAVGLLLIAGGFAQAGAQVAVEAEVVSVSRYVWRGFVLADGPAVQPGLTLGFGGSGLSLGLWGSAAVASRGAYGAADELDVTLGFDRNVGADDRIGFSIGYTQYTFPSAGAEERHTEEVFLGAALDHALAPSVTAFYDFGLVDGLHLSAQVAPELALGSEGAPILGLRAAVDASDAPDGGLGFHAVEASTSLGFHRRDLSVAPTLGLSYADPRVHPGAAQLWVGLSVGFSR